jgi:hypothetical protein
LFHALGEPVTRLAHLSVIAELSSPDDLKARLAAKAPTSSLDPANDVNKIAFMNFNYALKATRCKYVTALSGQRRATNSHGAGHAAGRTGGGGRANGPWAGRGRQPQR